MEYIQETLCVGQFADTSTQPWYNLTLGTYSNALLYDLPQLCYKRTLRACLIVICTSVDRLLLFDLHNPPGLGLSINILPVRVLIFFIDFKKKVSK
jgi:hypothetical protein